MSVATTNNERILDAALERAQERARIAEQGNTMERAELALLRGYVAEVATLDPAAVVALLRFAGYSDAADALDGAQQAELDGPRDAVFI